MLPRIAPLARNFSRYSLFFAEAASGSSSEIPPAKAAKWKMETPPQEPSSSKLEGNILAADSTPISTVDQEKLEIIANQILTLNPLEYKELGLVLLVFIDFLTI